MGETDNFAAAAESLPPLGIEGVQLGPPLNPTIYYSVSMLEGFQEGPKLGAVRYSLSDACTPDLCTQKEIFSESY